MKPTQRILCGLALCLSALGVPLAEPGNSVPVDALERLDREGTEALAGGEFRKSAEKFELLTTLAPESAEYSLKYGAALYFSEQYHACVHEFVRRDTLSPLDAENTLWHFLCTAQSEGVASAREHMLPARDDRVPMPELVACYAWDQSCSEVPFTAFSMYGEAGFAMADLRESVYLMLLRGLDSELVEGDHPVRHGQIRVREGARGTFLHTVADVMWVRHAHAALNEELDAPFVVGLSWWGQRWAYAFAGALLVGALFASACARRWPESNPMARTVTILALVWPVTAWGILSTWANLELAVPYHFTPSDFIFQWGVMVGDHALLLGLVAIGLLAFAAHRSITRHRVEIPRAAVVGLTIGVVTVTVDWLFVLYTATPMYG